MKSLSIHLVAGLALTLTAAGAASAQTLVIGTSDARLCYEAALALHRNHRSDLQRCEAALQHSPLPRRDVVATHVNYGILLHRAGRPEDAMRSYNRAIQLSPGLGEVWLNRGILLMSTGDFAAAEADFTRALELGVRETHKAYYNRGLSYDSREMYPEAYADYHRALERRPNWSLPMRELERFEVVRNSR
ncbi:tetratricopeptide repeat protein [Glycocaulis sp.]